MLLGTSQERKKVGYCESCSPFEAKGGPSESVALYRHVEARCNADVGAHAIAPTLEHVYRGYYTVLPRVLVVEVLDHRRLDSRRSSIFPESVFLQSLQPKAHPHTPAHLHCTHTLSQEQSLPIPTQKNFPQHVFLRAERQNRRPTQEHLLPVLSW